MVVKDDAERIILGGAPGFVLKEKRKRNDKKKHGNNSVCAVESLLRPARLQRGDLCLTSGLLLSGLTKLPSYL